MHRALLWHIIIYLDLTVIAKPCLQRHPHVSIIDNHNHQFCYSAFEITLSFIIPFMLLK